MREITIDGRRIDDDSDCWVIAEIGNNHQGDIEKCRTLFGEAKAAGADAVKLQKRSNRDLYTRSAFDYPYDNENSFGLTYGEHREALEFDRSQYAELSDCARELGLTFFATAFDLPSVDFLMDVGVAAIKIASGDLRSVHLLEYAGRTSVPVILSTGGGEMDDVKRAVDTLGSSGTPFAVLQCTAAYPPEYADLDLRVISTFRDMFPDVVVGYSGHDSGIAMALLAYALGARIVEKHFTLNRAMRGTDHAFSLEPVGLRKLVRDLQRARVALGSPEKRVHESERTPIVKMSKKIVAARSLPSGHVLTADDLTMKSPGDGLYPYELPRVLGGRLVRSLAEDETLCFDDLVLES